MDHVALVDRAGVVGPRPGDQHTLARPLPAVIGEIGVFAPDHKRTATVTCRTNCVVYKLTERRTKELYFQNPAFGYGVLQLIIKRLLENQQLIQPAGAPASARAARSTGLFVVSGPQSRAAALFGLECALG
jgi:CRP-like cAMP-binding protein